MFVFEELDNVTRRFMLQEFEDEEHHGPYRSQRLSAQGLKVFPELMREAILGGNEGTLAQALCNPVYWIPKETYHRNGVPHQRTVNPLKAAEFLAYTEFSTWYVRGLAKRLLSEGITECEVYRAAPALEPRPECRDHDGKVFLVQQIYDGHRAKYWPAPGNPLSFSIPAGTNCHHLIRRVKTQVHVG